MDYRALAELVMMSLFGLSTLVFAAGLSIRLFLAPTLRNLLVVGEITKESRSSWAPA